MSQQYRLASIAAWLSSTGISHHNLLPHICLSTLNSSPSPGIAPQSLNPSFQPLCLPGDLHLYPGMFHDTKDCLILIPLRLPQISCFISLKCFYSDSDNCPDVEIGTLLQFPQWLRAGPVLLTLLVWFYIFFSTGQVHLSALCWYSACTSVS